MIVRILTEDQYRLADTHMDEVRKLDDELDAALEANDSTRFDASLEELVALVRAHGQPLPMDEVVASDLIVPAPDMSLAEAKTRLSAIEAKAQPEE
ncbi:MAG: hypothetical protein OJF49_004851 [Ktedonobacterales bacterium]|jgi:hypothetical protein|nr:MAG: hypothetical protein OJF49_004851 [Ktedonobacterales bacterium]